MDNSLSRYLQNEGANARGGTELMVQNMLRHVPHDLLSNIHISVSTVATPARHLKPHILWAHQSFDQPTVQNLKDPHVLHTIDYYVFLTEWQREKYIEHFHIPRERTTVIRYAIEPFPPTAPRKKEPLRLIYTSTPFRGLDVLIEAFSKLTDRAAELHIYSGMTLYGRSGEDARFAELYRRAVSLPNVTYHGVVPNEEIHHAVGQAHIFAYPSTWEETACLALIEAQSAGCLAVVSRLGALPETASGFAQSYPFIADPRAHAERFRQELESAIRSYWLPETQARLREQVEFFRNNYTWEARTGEWVAFLEFVIHTNRHRLPIPH